jgi:hypothetical protein
LSLDDISTGSQTIIDDLINYVLVPRAIYSILMSLDPSQNRGGSIGSSRIGVDKTAGSRSDGLPDTTSTLGSSRPSPSTGSSGVTQKSFLTGKFEKDGAKLEAWFDEANRRLYPNQSDEMGNAALLNLSPDKKLHTPSSSNQADKIIERIVSGYNSEQATPRPPHSVSSRYSGLYDFFLSALPEGDQKRGEKAERMAKFGTVRNRCCLYTTKELC